MSILVPLTFSNEIRSDWFIPLEKEHTTGAVYINNRMIAECDFLEDVYQTDGACVVCKIR